MDRPGGTVPVGSKGGRRRAGHSTSVRYPAEDAYARSRSVQSYDPRISTGRIGALVVYPAWGFARHRSGDADHSNTMGDSDVSNARNRSKKLTLHLAWLDNPALQRTGPAERSL